MKTAAFALADLHLTSGNVEIRMDAAGYARAAAADAAIAEQRRLRRNAQERLRQAQRERLLSDARRAREQVAVRKRRAGQPLEEVRGASANVEVPSIIEWAPPALNYSTPPPRKRVETQRSSRVD